MKKVSHKAIIVLLIGYIFSGIALSQDQVQDNTQKDYEYHIKLAKEYIAKSQWDEALEEYNEAITLKPNDAHLYYARVLTNLLKLHTGELDEISLSDILFEARVYEKPRCDTIIDDLSRAIELEPNNAVFYWLRGMWYLYKMNEGEEAIKDFNKAATNLKADVALFLRDRGKAYSRIGEYKKAINYLSRAISLKPDSKEKLYSLFVKPYERVFNFGFLKDYENEKEELTDFYYSRACAYEKDGQLRKAIIDYEQSLLLIPSYIIISCSDITDVYKKANKLPEGVKFFSKLISLKPRANFYECRASIYSELKQYDKAIKDYTKAIELEPDLGDLYISRGDLYVQTNQRQKARADYEKACSLKEGLCYYLEDFEKEEEELKKAEEKGINWIWFGNSGGESWYYDKTRIKTLPNKHIRVWIRSEVYDVNAYIERLKKVGYSQRYENKSYSLTLSEIDCINENMGFISIVVYGSKGEVLDTFHNPEKEVYMYPIVPGSIMDALYKIVCKKKQ